MCGECDVCVWRVVYEHKDLHLPHALHDLVLPWRVCGGCVESDVCECTDLFWHSLGTLDGDSVFQAPPTPKGLIKFHMTTACNVMVIRTWSVCRRE